MTEQASPTPGPWDIFSGKGKLLHVDSAETGEHVCSLPMSHGADARLIAAAPEGLAANREALDFIQSYFGPVAGDDPNGWSDEDARQVALALAAAIAKAEGR